MLALVLLQALLEAGEEAGLAGLRCVALRPAFQLAPQPAHSIGAGAGVTTEATTAGATGSAPPPAQARQRAQAPAPLQLRNKRSRRRNRRRHVLGAVSSTSATGSSATGKFSHGSALASATPRLPQALPVLALAQPVATPARRSADTTRGWLFFYDGCRRGGWLRNPVAVRRRVPAAFCAAIRTGLSSRQPQLGSSCRRWNQTWRTAISK